MNSKPVLTTNLPLTRPLATLSPAPSGGEGRVRARRAAQGFKAQTFAGRILPQLTLLVLMLPGTPLFSATNNPATPTRNASDRNHGLEAQPPKAINLVAASAEQSREQVLAFLKSRGHGTYLFGQVATWVHNENPDMDHPSNWIKKVHDHTGRFPRYGCVTYDFDDNPFSDAAWNEGVRKLWDRGLIVGIYSFFANPAGVRWNDPCDIEQIWSPDENPVKTHFYRQLDRMAANLQWLRERGIPVIYTPFVESNDRNKWHAKQGSEAIIRLYRLVHDYFQVTKKLDNIIWAYHTTQNSGALKRCYPGDEYVDVLGKSAYGTGLVFSEYEWAVAKKKDHGKVIWWAELGIRRKSDPARDCFDVLQKLESHFPELAGFVFWSDEGFYNVTGNLNGKEFMGHPKIVTLGK